MKILIIGNGAREHALLWKLRRDTPDAAFFVARGNGGTREIATSLPLDPADVPALVAWAESQAVDLTVVGPEGPLAEGIVDAFARRGLPIFGPTRAAAAIEASKSFAKGLMRSAGVPTAGYAAFHEAAEAEAYIRNHPVPMVVKASGLAGGKGALICESVDEAMAAAASMMRQHLFGTAGQEIVVEEFLRGEELSVFAITDGRDVVTLPTAQDYKRIGENDAGPNTGGMGATSPVTLADDALLERIRREILLPTLTALREAGRPYRGLLYAGLMLTEEGPKVIEFNARFGDPETQAVLPLLSSSLLDPLLAVARGEPLPRQSVVARPGFALTTVLAAAGYPGKSESGREVTIPGWIREAEHLCLFHGGTRREGDRLLTTGGRVIAVTAVAPSIEEAAERSRAAADAIHFDGKRYRRDIGWRELARHAGAA